MKGVKLEIPKPFDGSDGSDDGCESEILKPFPLECLPPLVQTYARQVSEVTKTPDRLVGCSALGVLSASIGKGLEVPSESYRATRGNLYILASAESGTGKSEAFRLMTGPLQEFEKEQRETWRENDCGDLLARRDLLEIDIADSKKAYAKMHHVDAGEELKKYETDLEALKRKLHEPVFIVEDITTERLALDLSRNGETLASFSSDALVVVNVLLGRYNRLDRTDEGLYLKCFSGDPIRVSRVSRDGSISLFSPCLSALWLTQPDKLQAILDSKSLNEGGLVPRLLVCHTYCEAQFIPEEQAPFPEAPRKAYAGLVFALLSNYRLAPEPFSISPAPAALSLLRKHYNATVERRRNELRDVTSYAARWTEQAWRIAVCLHAGTHGSSAHEQPLSPETVRHAIALADWFAAEQLQILQPGRTEKYIARANKLLELIKNNDGTITFRDLQKNHNIGQREVRSLAARFPNHFAIERIQTIGRPSLIVRLPKK
jgi:replicative DNA helicase